MKAGRPFNSITPAWRNKALVKVMAYRFLMGYKNQEATKAGCARYMSLSRTTVIKHWDALDWTADDFEAIDTIKDRWHIFFGDEENVGWFRNHFDYEEEYVKLMRAVLDLLYCDGHIKYWHVKRSGKVKEL